MLSCHVAVVLVEVMLVPMMTEELVLVAFKAESLLRALAGMRMVVFQTPFLLETPLRHRAGACVLVMLFGCVHFSLTEFIGLSVLCGSSRTWTWMMRSSWTWTW